MKEGKERESKREGKRERARKEARGLGKLEQERREVTHNKSCGVTRGPEEQCMTCDMFS